MANVESIIGFNRIIPTEINKLLAAYGNDVIDLDAGTGYGLNLTNSDESVMRQMLDSVFYQDYAKAPITFNGVSWSKKHVSNPPIAKSMFPFKNRMYLGYCAFNYAGDATSVLQDQDGNTLIYPSRVFYPELPTASSSASRADSIKWGLEWGTNGKINANSDIFMIASPVGRQNFEDNGIKVGDPLFITKATSASTVGKYTILEVKSPYSVRLDKTFDTADTSVHFWSGSNWFDVGEDNGDYHMGFEENDDALLNFKRFSLWRYNISSIKKISNAPGTTSRKSVITIGRYTFYFHGSNTNTRRTGIWMYSGGNSVLATRGIQDYIDGIPASSYDDAVAWQEGTKLRMFVGTVTNVPKDISMTNAVITYDTEGGQIDIGPIADVVTCSTRFVESSAEKMFIGTSDGEVMETPSGNDHNGTPIEWSMTLGHRYPSGSEVINEFTRVQIVSSGGRGIGVSYKLLGTPDDDDDKWNPIGDISHNNQELIIPGNHSMAKGIDIKLYSSDGNANNYRIRKISIFYVPRSTNNRV